MGAMTTYETMKKFTNGETRRAMYVDEYGDRDD